MRILIPITFLVIASLLFLPTAESQMVQVVVAGKAAAAAPSFSITEIGTAGPGSSTTTCAITTSESVGSGEDIIVLAHDIFTSAITCSADDSGDATYSNDLNYTDADQSYTRGCWVRGRQTSTLNSGSTVTVTASGSGSWSCAAYKVVGLKTDSPDETKTRNSYSASMSVTADNALDQASELVLGHFAMGATDKTLTATNGYTIITDRSVSTKRIFVLYQKVATTTAPAITGTASAAESYAATLLAYKLQ
jgi:hypothetical protein